MNSTPAASRVAWISIKVEERLGGTASYCSRRWMVGTLTPDLAANSDADHLTAALAARIWPPVIIISNSTMMFFIS
jgi:hypothetical protein